MNIVEVNSFSAPEWNRREIKRYARIRGAGEGFEKLIDECIREAEPVLSYRVCYSSLPVEREGELLTFGTISTRSKTIRKAIGDENSVVIFAATVGAPFDLLIRRYSKLSPAKALVLQAIGAERVESLCDLFCKKYTDVDLFDGGLCLLPRVSPGYGDIPLEMQREIFAMLDCQRKIGLTLDESLLMSPSKSVTAICGITAKVGTQCSKDVQFNCSLCAKKECPYRR